MACMETVTAMKSADADAIMIQGVARLTKCANCGNDLDFHEDAKLYVCLKRLSKEIQKNASSI
jgi:hypothetical protein